MGANNPKRIVFLCSGGGGNLRFIHHAIKQDWLRDTEIVAVLTDRDCQANQFATAVGIPNQRIDFSDDGQQALLSELRIIQPDLIVTTVHKILKKPVVEQYSDKLINLHYSLLPSFGGLIGMNPVKAAIDYGAKLTGVTVHLVDEQLDGGEPIVHVAIPLQSKEEDFASLENLIFRCGCIALLHAIPLRMNGVPAGPAQCLTLMNRCCLVNPGAENLYRMIDESTWQAIAASSSTFPRPM